MTQSVTARLDAFTDAVFDFAVTLPVIGGSDASLPLGSIDNFD